MATTEEIRRRVEEADTARSAKRSAAAQEVGELAHRRAAVAEQLEDIERQLGDALAAAQEVIDINELAKFTEIPAADLMRWLNGRKAIRTKRKRPTNGAPATKKDPSQGISPATSQASTPPEPAVARADTKDASTRMAAAAVT